MLHNRWMNIRFKFTKKFSHGEKWQFGPNLAQDYEILHLMCDQKIF